MFICTDTAASVYNVVKDLFSEAASHPVQKLIPRTFYSALYGTNIIKHMDLFYTNGTEMKAL